MDSHSPSFHLICVSTFALLKEMSYTTQQQQRRRRQRNQNNPIGTAVAIGAVAVGAYFVGRSLWNNFIATDNEEEERTPSLSSQQIDRRLQACQQHARTLYSSIAPAVHKAVLQATPVSEARRELRAARQEQAKRPQHEAWHALRVATLTRLVVNAYSHSILLCMVWTHVHRIEQTTLRYGGNATTASTISTQWCRTFIDHGIEQGIVEPVRAVVEHVLASTDIWDCFALTAALHMTADKVEQTLLHICQECNAASDNCDDASTASPLCWWTKLPLSAETNATKVEEEEQLDLWESPLAQMALRECLSCTVESLLRNIRTSMFPEDQELPVAKVVAELKSHGDDWETSWSQWVALPNVRTLGRVVLLDGCTEN